MTIYGIDLGTSNSVIAGDDEVLPCPNGSGAILPSAVAFMPNGVRKVGKAARRRRAIDSDNTVYSSKRIIGRRWDAQETQNFVSRYPFRLVELDGWPAFETRAGRVTPTEVGAIILDALCERGDLPVQTSEVHLTVPASFSTAQRDATEQAAKLAGLQNVSLIEEPSATAYAYLHADEPFERAIVYDLGGGTFDCAVLECVDGEPRITAHASDLVLGGDDIDHQIAAWVARYVIEKHNWDLTNYSEVYDRLLARCEDAKIQLSDDTEAEIHLSQVDPECPAAEEVVTLTRALIEDLCQDLVRRTFIACDSVIRSAGVTPLDIDAVLLAGGASFMPVIQKGVAAYFGHSGRMSFDPTEVVALGASVAHRVG
ncbi:MAG: Hsp70 family protein [Deltaproteobacteria bacterium]|nr:Hsp70 family protein [Deltaproteobacteria bacterium]MBW2698647.1 Hsp70 family protein [Deltaproteobacteria bacterium]